MNWQPIETAPKDGADVLLFTPKDEPQIVVGYWADSWGGWNWRDSLLADMSAEEMSPTHWQPLLAPPSDEPRYTITEAGRAMLRDAQQGEE